MSENKQKVLIVHNYYQIPGGEDTVVANEKKLLEAHGHEVILYTRDNSELKNMNMWKRLLLPFTTIYNPKTAKDVKRIIREYHIDIVHVHNTLNLISPSVYYAARACGIPIVQTIHNFRALCPGATFYRDGHICEDCIKYSLRCAIQHSCYRGSKLQTLACVINTKIHRMTGIYGKINYICLTEFNKEKLLSLNKSLGKELIKADRIFIKPNFTFDSSEQLGRTGKYYLFVGRLEKIKGIDLLLEAFSKIPGVELHIAGSGKEKYENAYRNCHNITFLGQLDKKDLSEEYKGAKALIVTAQTYEGFPMTLVESFGYGLPIIVGNMGNSGGLVDENITGIHYQYDDAAALIMAVHRYENIDNTEMRKNAFKKFTESYTAEANYDQLLKIYKEAEK